MAQNLTSDEKAMQKLADDWVKGEQDPIFFIENFCMLKDQKRGRAIPFKLWPCQKEQLRIWQSGKRHISLKTRQIGISWLSAAFMLQQMCKNNYFEGMVISKKEQDAVKYLDKVKFMYEHLPEIVKNIIVPLARPSTRLQMELQNGSMAMAESSNPEAGRSETLNLLIIDEAAFIELASSIWVAAEPTLEKTDGTAIFISTANGYDKLFQPIWQGAENQENGFTRYFIPWSGDPDRTQEWYDRREKQALTRGSQALREFHQEYPRNFIEAFIITGSSFFDPDVVQSHLTSPHPQFYQARVDLTRTQHQIDAKSQFVQNSNGELKIWKHPEDLRQYVIGIDTAEGIQTGDNSIAAVYDRYSMEQVAEFAGKVDTDEFAKVCYVLGHYYNKAMLNIEMNSVGESLLNYISKQRHYPKIYRQMRFDERSNKKVKKLGFRTTATTKRLLIDSLDQQLREREIKPHSLEFFEELKTFVITKTDLGNYRYGASGNNHDDRVIAHALCAVVFQEQPLRKPHNRNTRYSGATRFQHKIKTPPQYDQDKLFA